MTEMLTAKDVQEMLHVDRSTVYRMAEAGRIPALKVGKQWRFPVERIESWFQSQMGTMAMGGGTAVSPTPSILDNQSNTLAELLPMECVQIIQDPFADLLGVMLVITDMEGNPITQPSNACGLFNVISPQPDAIQKCIQSWHDLATVIDLNPKFSVSHLGLLCARSMIRVGVELKGMVIAGCITPDQWPPTPEEVETMAAEFGVPVGSMMAQLDGVYTLDKAQQAQVLAYLPRIANIVAHIVDERKSLVGRLQTIARLTKL
ncbi:MAG: helix-turn-helix domain-containing protein [Chloroflexi bacterium]|nr:helix-turn-helix domain-containing protein [Chloroflexota bacterium]